MFSFRFSRRVHVADLIAKLFAPVTLAEVEVRSREFPYRMRADLQRALNALVAEAEEIQHFSSINSPHAYDGLSFSALLNDQDRETVVVPPEYEDLDIGEPEPVRVLRNGLWLAREGTLPYALLVAPSVEYGRESGMQVSVAKLRDDESDAFCQRFFRRLEQASQQSRCYRGKILSLECDDRFTGKATGVRVHKLQPIAREQIILPDTTLQLLERNVIDFVRQRPRLAKFGYPVKKGVLFYGPPGVGKTHTIRYLASALVDHTTLLVTAEQVGILDEYVALARLLQPSIIVIEDVDLIARERERIREAGVESLLNKLLNEMDGLREDAEILFLLTTNRPEALEKALASRPGRVDQAIEFPLPQDPGRRKLIRLYARDAALSDELVSTVSSRTAGVSAAFIKELMRRAMQFHLESGEDGELRVEDVEAAMDELLFKGGQLNVTLLGGAATPKGAEEAST